MTNSTRRGTIGLALVLGLLTAGGLAAATPDSAYPTDTDPEIDEPTNVIEYEFVDDLNLLVYWLPGDDLVNDDGEQVDCVGPIEELPKPDDATADPSHGTDQSIELPDGCHATDVAGPNGQVNHGTVMSAFVHSIKEIDYDGPRGHLVQELAKSDLGKGDQQLKVNGDEADGEGDNDEAEVLGDNTHTGGGPPDHAKAHGRKDNKERN